MESTLKSGNNSTESYVYDVLYVYVYTNLFKHTKNEIEILSFFDFVKSLEN